MLNQISFHGHKNIYAVSPVPGPVPLMEIRRLPAEWDPTAAGLGWPAGAEVLPEEEPEGTLEKAYPALHPASVKSQAHWTQSEAAAPPYKSGWSDGPSRRLLLHSACQGGAFMT
ncbi:unnamed protein product [Boreogadus saida]